MPRQPSGEDPPGSQLSRLRLVPVSTLTVIGRRGRSQRTIAPAPIAHTASATVSLVRSQLAGALKAE